MRSLTLKLILAFVVVCLIQALLVGFLVREQMQRAFNRYVTEEAIEVFSEDAEAYYRQYGSWEDMAGRFGRQVGARQRPPRPQPGGEGGRRPPGAMNPRFGLADENGRVMLSNGSYPPGSQVPPEVLSESTPLMIDGVQRAVMLLPIEGPAFSPREREYLDGTNAALRLALLGALGVALLLGVWAAQTYMRPLQELTKATQSLAQGELGQQVAVRSQDELGVLTEAFNKMSADLAEATELRRRMTADIAHDLRTPLTVITGYLEAMRDGVLAPTPARFEAMYAEAKHLTRLVADLRTLSLADAGELTLTPQPVNPYDLLERVRNAFSRQAEEQQIDLHLTEGPSLPDCIVDTERMAQVLGNLVSNALRYTPEGGAISLSARSAGETLSIEVVDTGMGIPRDALPYLFDRFYRVEAARSRQEGESGLGLAIARSIVEAHGGTIEAASRMGEGTTFTIRLPQARSLQPAVKR